jgi:hypothetical protein
MTYAMAMQSMKFAHIARLPNKLLLQTSRRPSTQIRNFAIIPSIGMTTDAL